MSDKKAITSDRTNRRQERNIRDIVWSENRDAIFLEWLVEDITRLQNAGFLTAEIKRILGTLRYVRFWCANPSWLYPIKGLPKGFHRCDGQRFSRKKGQKCDGCSYILLPIGTDLFIKGISAVGTKIDDYPGVKIKDYQSLTCAEVSVAFPGMPTLESALHSFWHSQGLRLGYVAPCLRPFKHNNTKEEECY